jgi:cystathionine gamma-synthase
MHSTVDPLTRLAHAGVGADAPDVAPALHFSSTFVRDAQGEAQDGLIYGREVNPTRRQVEQVLAELEGGAAAAAFGSGLAAVSAALMALSPGDHILVHIDGYLGTRKLIDHVLTRWGLSYTEVDLRDLSAAKVSMKPSTRLIWCESPTNPSIHVLDIAALAELAHAHSARLALDNTFATPLLQNPISLGADLVMHSTTKSMGGHSDFIGGALITARDDDFWQRIVTNQVLMGGVPSPFDCWLLLRGLRSLGARLTMAQASAAQLATWLEAQPQIAAVHYPGLASHPGHIIHQRQARGSGAMISIELKGGFAAAATLARSTRVFTQATSLGGTESLIEHRAGVEGSETKSPAGLVRLSIGLESAADLQADLAQALQKSV